METEPGLEMSWSLYAAVNCGAHPGVPDRSVPSYRLQLLLWWCARESAHGRLHTRAAPQEGMRLCVRLVVCPSTDDEESRTLFRSSMRTPVAGVVSCECCVIVQNPATESYYRHAIVQSIPCFRHGRYNTKQRIRTKTRTEYPARCQELKFHSPKPE